MSQIKVGDLVQIVRLRDTCSCPSTHIGTMFTVSQILHHSMRCIKCGIVWGPVWQALDASDGLWCELWRLKRIPPLEELEGERTEESLKEPA